MEFHPEMVEQQVWQRVLQQQNPREPMRELILSSGELAAVYRQLAGTLAGRPRELAKQLYEGETATLAALKGLNTLSGREAEVLKLWQPGKEPAGKLLEKAYHRTRCCMVDYAARTAEPEFGVVFQKLADRAALHCVLIAQLLGTLG